MLKAVIDAMCDAFSTPITSVGRRYEDTLACLEVVKGLGPRVGVEPDEAIMVGYSIKWDVEGAINSGIRPVHIDRESSGGLPVTRIRSLTQLVAVLEGLS